MDILTTPSLIARREALGMTREALAIAAGVEGSTLWRIEKSETDGNIKTWRALLSTLDSLEAHPCST